METETVYKKKKLKVAKFLQLITNSENWNFGSSYINY